MTDLSGFALWRSIVVLDFSNYGIKMKLVCRTVLNSGGRSPTLQWPLASPFVLSLSQALGDGLRGKVRLWTHDRTLLASDQK